MLFIPIAQTLTHNHRTILSVYKRQAVDVFTT